MLAMAQPALDAGIHSVHGDATFRVFLPEDFQFSLHALYAVFPE